ncbi:hypothetical protein BC938DRAFT_471041 [Jimgerdemannia flammicorona]|uniref:Scaffold protein Tuba n=1 Tax=Jimgerdemannia flammicorona TaxID=994334 RepID=A0A433Q8Y5_9FUNG|nr:hypothetical protein BC938DRAFT_471041 [Jimgerdemannia flammicorona]
MAQMRQLEETYCEYVKRHESSVLKLQEMEANKEVKDFLKKCHEQVQGKTKSWDVFSLLVKPVQRVLKYPLLLDLILSLTPPAHPDYRELQGAAREIQEVADRINEIKRRKDIVEKIVGDRKRTDVNVCVQGGSGFHGINKTITRRAQKFKQVTGMGEITIDIFYDALCQRFTEQQETARQLERDIQLWIDDVRNYFEIAKIFAKTIEDLYDTWPGANTTSLQRAADFRKCVNGFTDSCGLDLEKRVNNIYPTIVAFLNVFKNPAQVMRKREKKLLDYDRVRGIKARGDIPDKALQESADAYVSINTQLAEELPKFFNLTITYFDYIVQEFSVIQAKFYQQMVEDLQLHMYKGISALAASEMRMANVVEGYWEAVDRPGGLESEIRTIGLLNKRMVPRSGASSPNWSEIGGATLTRRRSQSGSLSLTGESDYVRKPVASPPTPAPSLSGGDDGHSTTTAGATNHTASDDSLFRCVALYTYHTTSDEELAFKKDTVIDVWYCEGEDKDAWWYGKMVDEGNEVCGWFPASYWK